MLWSSTSLPYHERQRDSDVSGAAVARSWLRRARGAITFSVMDAEGRLPCDPGAAVALLFQQ